MPMSQKRADIGRTIAVNLVEVVLAPVVVEVDTMKPQ
jgi:hypothetical protein